MINPINDIINIENVNQLTNILNTNRLELYNYNNIFGLQSKSELCFFQICYEKRINQRAVS